MSNKYFSDAKKIYEVITNLKKENPSYDGLVVLETQYIHLRMAALMESVILGESHLELPHIERKEVNPDLVQALLDKATITFSSGKKESVVCSVSNGYGFVIGRGTSSSDVEAKKQALNNAKYNITFAENYARQMGYMA